MTCPQLMQITVKFAKKGKINWIGNVCIASKRSIARWTGNTLWIWEHILSINVSFAIFSPRSFGLGKICFPTWIHFLALAYHDEVYFIRASFPIVISFKETRRNTYWYCANKMLWDVGFFFILSEDISINQTSFKTCQSLESLSRLTLTSIHHHHHSLTAQNSMNYFFSLFQKW